MAVNGKPKTARNFRNYKVWQDAVAYATEVYKVASEMPWFEKKGLCDQLKERLSRFPQTLQKAPLNRRMWSLPNFLILPWVRLLKSKLN